METAIEKSNGAALAEPVTPKGIITAEALRADTEQRRLLTQYVAHHMLDCTDYGKIPGTDKPTLLKPGAEKLVDLFRCTPKFALIERTEDFDRNLFAYTFRVRLYQRDAGAVVAEGFGSANSREGRYRWRNAQRKCPLCHKETIIRGKPEYGGGWLCWRSKGGCGEKFADGDKGIESQEVGKVENDDVATLANTILKMAKKRALVDGAIALARCSDLFTQDLDDLPREEEPPPPAKPAPKQSAPAERTASGAERKMAIRDEPPAQPSPAAIEAKRKVDETTAKAAVRAGMNRLWEKAQSLTTKEGFAQWRARVLGVRKPNDDLTAEDLAKLDAAFAELEPPKEAK